MITTFQKMATKVGCRAPSLTGGRSRLTNVLTKLHFTILALTLCARVAKASNEAEKANVVTPTGWDDAEVEDGWSSGSCCCDCDRGQLLLKYLGRNSMQIADITPEAAEDLANREDIRQVKCNQEIECDAIGRSSEGWGTMEQVNDEPSTSQSSDSVNLRRAEQHRRLGWDKKYHMMVFEASKEALSESWDDALIHCLTSFAEFSRTDIILVTDGDYKGFRGVFNDVACSSGAISAELWNIQRNMKHEVLDGKCITICKGYKIDRWNTIPVRYNTIQWIDDISLDSIDMNLAASIVKTNRKVLERAKIPKQYDILQRNADDAEAVVHEIEWKRSELSTQDDPKLSHRAATLKKLADSLKHRIEAARNVLPDDTDLRTLKRLSRELSSYTYCNLRNLSNM